MRTIPDEPIQYTFGPIHIEAIRGAAKDGAAVSRAMNQRLLAMLEAEGVTEAWLGVIYGPTAPFLRDRRMFVICHHCLQRRGDHDELTEKCLFAAGYYTPAWEKKW